jgi:hypothetical protein
MLRANAPLDVVDKFCECSVEKFRFHFLSKRSMVDETCRLYAGKDPAVVKRATALDPVKVRALCLDADQRYRSLFDADMWTPALTKDKEQVPAAFQAEIRKQAARLVKEEFSKRNGNDKRDASNVTCFRCGKKGHFARDCPDKDDSGHDNGTPRGNQGNNSTWKTEGPKNGEPTTKTVDGKEYHWCVKCGQHGRWVLTHTTETHKSKEELKAERENKKNPGEGPKGTTAATPGTTTSNRILFGPSVL